MKFDKQDLKKLFRPKTNSNGEDNGQITIIGGSELFHGAPILPLKVASRIVDMVFFTSPEKSVGTIAENIKSKLMSCMWVRWQEGSHYINKSDAILIGPGFMSYRSEEDKSIYEESKTITHDLLANFPKKKWIIDAGSLQVMDPKWIPQNAILPPNKKEYKMLFGDLSPQVASKKYNCIIVLKGPTTYVFRGGEAIEIDAGSTVLTQGGSG